MKFVFLNAASTQEPWSNAANELYLNKLKHFVKTEIVSLAPQRSSRSLADTKKQDESQRILEFLKPEDYVILFDERGSSLDSIQFSQKMEQILSSSKKRAVFIIGGAFGVSESVQARANLKISFSKMVFNHLVAQTVAMEQTYRAFTILKNLPYHNS